MKNVVGNPARGDSFFQRDREIAKVLDRIKNGNNIQIAAPRRVGKTSILYHLMDNKPNDDIYIYVDTEAINNEQDFFKKIMKEFLKVEAASKAGWLQKVFEKGGRYIKKIKTIKILGQEIEFDETGEKIDYKQELENLLLSLIVDEGVRVILLIDEFPQTIQNIVEANKGDNNAAIQFLQSNRELRLNPEINEKVVFIYTGSIGLNHTVSAIEGSAFINDLNSIEVEPLTRNEAKQFLLELFLIKSLAIEEEGINYLFDKIEWLVPFHIQLLVQEILSMTSKADLVSRDIIDTSFEKLIQARNNNHFEHYHSRLKKQFKNQEFEYAENLLENIALNSTIERGIAFDLSMKYGMQERWNQIIEILMYDGYINNVGNKNLYRFNSPILRMWWLRFICK